MVRQAHLPGNYELYDPLSNAPGPGICKGCWEQAGIRATTSLRTVWVSVEGRPMVWWLCHDHAEALKTSGHYLKLLKSENRIVSTPRI